MIDSAIISQLNKVIKEYFEKNSTVTIIPVKELMPEFIAAGIFKKDHRKGLPIRQVLRALDDENQLGQVEFVHTERKEQNVYWYFIPTIENKPETPYKQELPKTEVKELSLSKDLSDRNYIIGLCDKFLKKKSFRQKTFGFLLGDVHKNGKSQTRLPVDAFYEDLQLVVEYKEKHRDAVVQDQDDEKQAKQTVSGMSRVEQRKHYDGRRAEVLPKYGIQLINIKFSDFKSDETGALNRNEERDIKVIERKLKSFIS